MVIHLYFKRKRKEKSRTNIIDIHLGQNALIIGNEACVKAPSEGIALKLDKTDYIFITLVTLATFAASILGTTILGLPKTRPDSRYYLAFVDILRGLADPSTATPPFCYRPLMPIIVALIPADPVTTWNLITLLLNAMIAPVVYLLIKEFDVSSFGAFAGTGLTTVNLISAAYGVCVLTDVPAMLFLAIVLLLLKREEKASVIIPIMVIGVLFKELVILGAAVWMFRALLQRDRRGFIEGTVAAIISFATYLTVRGIWSLFGVEPNWYWHWNDLFNLTTNISVTIKSLWLGFMFWIPAMFVALIVLWKDYENMHPKFEWMFQLSPVLLLFFAGLFMAYFSLRFIWPLYFAMAPAGGYAAEWTWDRMMEKFGGIFGSKESEQPVDDAVI